MQLAEDEKYGPRGGYDHYGFSNAPTGWDPTLYTKSKSVNSVSGYPLVCIFNFI